MFIWGSCNIFSCYLPVKLSAISKTLSPLHVGVLYQALYGTAFAHVLVLPDIALDSSSRKAAKPSKENVCPKVLR